MYQCCIFAKKDYRPGTENLDVIKKAISNPCDKF